MVIDIRQALINELTVSLNSIVNRSTYKDIEPKVVKKTVKKLLKRIIKANVHVKENTV